MKTVKWEFGWNIGMMGAPPCRKEEKTGPRIGKSIEGHGMDNKRLLSGKQNAFRALLNCAAHLPRPQPPAQLPAQLRSPHWLRRQN